MPALELRGVTKRFELGGRSVVALDRVDLEAQPGAFVAVVGRSGCGKTTLLRAVAGLEPPDSGEIVLARGEGAPRIAMMFQDPRLMPWLTVRANIGFGLVGRLAPAEIDAIVNRQLQMLRIASFADAYPHQISGGMAQRTALGRALCLDPDLLLMDEPFGALDALTRRAMQDELIGLWRGDRTRSVLFVTHDVEEAVLLGQRVIVMERGAIRRDVTIDLPYPRRAEDQRLIELREQLIAEIMREEPATPG